MINPSKVLAKVRQALVNIHAVHACSRRVQQQSQHQGAQGCGCMIKPSKALAKVKQALIQLYYCTALCMPK
jgi:hypothetical protein